MKRSKSETKSIQRKEMKKTKKCINKIIVYIILYILYLFLCIEYPDLIVVCMLIILLIITFPLLIIFGYKIYKYQENKEYVKERLSKGQYIQVKPKRMVSFEDSIKKSLTEKGNFFATINNSEIYIYFVFYDEKEKNFVEKVSVEVFLESYEFME